MMLFPVIVDFFLTKKNLYSETVLAIFMAHGYSINKKIKNKIREQKLENFLTYLQCKNISEYPLYLMEY